MSLKNNSFILRYSTIIYLLLSSVCLFFASCAKYRNQTFNSLENQPKNIHLFIQQPANVMVHYNLAPVLYDELWHHFGRVGYQLEDNDATSYTLQPKIISWHVPDKFISPDVVVYGHRIKITVEFSLLRGQELVAKKQLSCSAIVSGPADPILTSYVMDREMHKVCERLAVKVDHWVRSKIL